MKKLTIVVPSFNSEDYLERCLNSLVRETSEHLEILIVNDGSTDSTGELAESYERAFPGIVRAIHQENGGHGAAVNTGIKEATGMYLKVVDSDDWVDPNALKTLLQVILQVEKSVAPDMIINNYVYEKQGARHKKTVQYRSFLPQNKVFDWREVRFPVGKYLLMHSLVFKTAILREKVPQLPHHTFYVDNLFAFYPLPFVKKMLYLDIDFYRYFIGRSDQSVNESVMIGRIDQQLFVNTQMVNYYSKQENLERSCARYMRQFLEIVTSVSSVLLMKQQSHDQLLKKRQLWEYIYKTDSSLYYRLRFSLLGQFVHLPGLVGRKTTLGMYRVCQKVYGFN
ncbi:glycosyltransferase family 2 protein [Listeria kieliensis]|uniref:Glycosyl transferase n=1 Tax=Listeria kieliensis TaxID=1621700 RepID=A0A3D8TLI5_9LIST|nr:glycosyltransferase family 2 protein [Listeria kieliensis]RDW99098.1 glycosyl transferase [Listeria kieliensis]